MLSRYMAIDEFVKTSCAAEAINVMVFEHEKDYQGGEETIYISFWGESYTDCKYHYQRWTNKLKDIWSIIRTGYPRYHKEHQMLGIYEAEQLIVVLNRAIEAAKPKVTFNVRDFGDLATGGFVSGVQMGLGEMGCRVPQSIISGVNRSSANIGINSALTAGVEQVSR